jgi:hypothetical protein
MSRRDFVGSATASVGGMGLLGLRGFPHFNRRTGRDCVVLDLGADCVLRESLEGYRTALGVEQACLTVSAAARLGPCRMAIVPGVGYLDSATISALSDLLQQGIDVLLESGAGFLSEGECCVQQRMLQRAFGLLVEAPVDLRSAVARGTKLVARQFLPYVHYVWPCQALVRDFSRVVPVLAPTPDVIGRAGSLPVAAKAHVGGGLLIFLGSPLGPSLRAGDLEAKSWLSLLLASSSAKVENRPQPPAQLI